MLDAEFCKYYELEEVSFYSVILKIIVFGGIHQGKETQKRIVVKRGNVKHLNETRV